MKSNCEICYSICTLSREDVEANEACYFFLNRKQYADLDSGGLVLPSPPFLDFVKEMEVVLRKHMPIVINQPDVSKHLFALCAPVVDQGKELFCGSDPCESTLVYIMQLYIRTRIHHVLRKENRRIQMPNQKRNRKFLKLSYFGVF